MNITFTLKRNSIYYRFRNGRKLSVIRKLPFSNIQASDWSTTKQKLKPKHLQPVNTRLTEFKAYLLLEINNSIVNEEAISLEWVKNKQHDFFNTSETDENFKIYLYQYLEHYIQTEIPDNKFTNLKKHIPKGTRIIEVDIKWLSEFSKNQLNDKYSPSTIAKNIQRIKRLLKHAEVNYNIRINRSALDFRGEKHSSTHTYLTPDEIDLIFNHEYHTEYLNNAKRLFLTGLTTGMRVSDLMRIKEFKIDDYYIELITKKTKQPIIIPIDPRVKDYIPLLRPISHPKFNKYIKELCQIAGIDELTRGAVRGKDNKHKEGLYPKHELVVSHTMRRSFATNLYGKLPTIVIMAATGHTTEASFLTYIKKPQRDFAEQLKEYYSKKY